MLKLNKTKFEPKYVDMLIKVMIYKLKDTENTEGVLFRNKLQVLVQEICDELPFHPQVWALSIYFFEKSNLFGQESRLIDLLQKQVRGLKVEGWDNETDKFNRLTDAVIKLSSYQMKSIELTEDVALKKTLINGGSSECRSIIKRTEDTFSNLENYKKLEEILEKFNEIKSEL
jgi:hypothetical protein